MLFVLFVFYKIIKLLLLVVFIYLKKLENQQYIQEAQAQEVYFRKSNVIRFITILWNYWISFEKSFLKYFPPINFQKCYSWTRADFYYTKARWVRIERLWNRFSSLDWLSEGWFGWRWRRCCPVPGFCFYLRGFLQAKPFISTSERRRRNVS